MASRGFVSERPAEGWANVGELRIHYLDWGGDGPPLVALHGLASSSHWYDRVAPLLRSKHRIVAPDQRGHGKTTQAPSGYDWQTLSSDVVGLLDRLGLERVAVMGHSWGGNVATNLAARFPERVSALVMIDGGFLGGRFRLGTTWEAFKARLSPRDVSGTRQEYVQRMRTSLADCWGDDLERVILTMVCEDEQGRVRDILHPDNHAQVIKMMWDEPPSAILPRIACRTLIVPAGPLPGRAGTEFARSREEMVAAAAGALKDCRVHWIAETIHDIGYHKPRELARVIEEFLSQG